MWGEYGSSRNEAFITSVLYTGDPGASTRRTSLSTRAGEGTCSSTQHRNAASKLRASNGSSPASACCRV
ncbi:hypothetical protein G6F63_016944 [Rhizopus arrhizus]|nr:hypothetical protein G6F63_016944 [Rhizopus arrhizus]